MGQTYQWESAIFDAAVELPLERRAAYLDHACAGDAALRQRMEALLKACESSDGFLDSPADPTGTSANKAMAASFEKAGDTIGGYKLLQQIGEGGCGVVYMAQQERPVSRRVALKVIKLGLDTKSVVARFEAERQALALMDHPNIAKVLDAGAAETGRPYFVMELVRGLKITEYCDAARLSTNARLELFIQVCQAIQHAHQKGIIHRDIKPSNILVTINDGVPVPKVIDFGIAKATGGLKLTNKTLFTAFEQFIGTPAYMSPEQAVLTSVDIDTRSDIYALGVLLYELLTGRTPFDANELLAIGLDEMRRTIREQEPPRPSTRLSTLSGQELSTTAQRRGLDAPKLVSELHGDLDWIVMKALEKDRARRYETANGLAMDIQRHLKNEPVVACPPSAAYRFQKLVRRNKLAFAAGGAVAVSLVMGLTLSTVLLFRERAARERAKEQEALAKEQTGIATAVNEFLQRDLLGQADSRSQAEAHFTPDPGLTVRQALERAAEQIGNRFKGLPLQEAAVRMAIGDALIGVGEGERAVSHLQPAWELRRAKLGPSHPDTLRAMDHLAAAYRAAGKLDQALPLAEETLKLAKAKLGWDHQDTLNSMDGLALAYRAAGKYDQAQQLLEEMLKLRKATLGLDHPDTLRSMDSLAIAYDDAGKFDKALPLFEEALKLRKTALGPDHPESLRFLANLTLAYQDAGKLDQALPLLEETLKLWRPKLGSDPPDTSGAMDDLLIPCLYPGKLNQTLQLFEEMLKLQEARLGPDHPDTLNSMGGLAELHVTLANYTEAETWSRRLLTRIKQREGPPSAACANTLASLGRRILKRHQWAKAEPVLLECLSIREKIQPGEWGTFNVRSMLGGALLGQGKFAEAQPLVVAGYDGLRMQSKTKTVLGVTEDDLTDAMDRLEVLYESRRDQPEAARWKAEIERVRRVSDPGAIRRWLVLAPMALPADQSTDTGLELELLGTEANLRPRPGDKVSVGERELVWRECALRDYAIDFNELSGGETPESVAYAVCYVQVTTLRKDLVLKVGSDDQARVYLNGQKIYENRQPRSLKLDEDTISGVKLQAGLNVVVFKVVNGYLDWRGSLRFADKEDHPVQGIQITLDPD